MVVIEVDTHMEEGVETGNTWSRPGTSGGRSR